MSKNTRDIKPQTPPAGIQNPGGKGDDGKGGKGGK